MEREMEKERETARERQMVYQGHWLFRHPVGRHSYFTTTCVMWLREREKERGREREKERGGNAS